MTPPDAADDVYDAEFEVEQLYSAMRTAGCRPCDHPQHLTADECPACKDLGWLTANGEPCEL